MKYIDIKIEFFLLSEYDPLFSFFFSKFYGDSIKFIDWNVNKIKFKIFKLQKRLSMENIWIYVLKHNFSIEFEINSPGFS
jgi:hypothetical protein